MNQGLQTVKNILPQVYDCLPQLMAAMIKLTVEYEKKPVNNINKQFQDCIMNYFFEDIVGDLIKTKFNSITKNQIKETFMKEITEEMNMKRSTSQSSIDANKAQKTLPEKKYMLLPQKYIQEIICQKKESEYIKMLCQYILEDIHFTEGEIRWRSQIRKKVFSALLLVHFYNGYPIQSIFEMWDNTFPTQSIKNKKKEQDSSKKYQKKRQVAEAIQQEIEEQQQKNLVLPKFPTLSENGKRKCLSIQIIEPPISKKSQLDHYFQNFPSEFQQSSLTASIGSNNVLTPLKNFSSLQQRSVISEPETDQNENSSDKFQSQDQSSTYFDESLYSSDNLIYQNYFYIDQLKLENQLFSQNHHSLFFQNSQNSDNQDSLIEKCQNFHIQSDYDYENLAYQDDQFYFEKNYCNQLVDNSLNSNLFQSQNLMFNMQYFS